MTGSIATAPDPALGRRGSLDSFDSRWIAVIIGAAAAAAYLVSNPERQDVYNHFVWQAEAFLQGRVAIRWPIDTGPFQNGYFQDVYPLPDQPGYGLIPFPPLPAILLVPFVAIFGMATSAATVAAVVGGLNVALCWRMLTRVTDQRRAALLATFFYGFGTVAWYAAMLGSTWFFAHVVASTFLFLGIAAALDAERSWADHEGRRRLLLGWIEPRQFAAGLLFGTAALARLTTIFGAPFFVLVGGGGTMWRRAVSAGLGAVIPVALLIGYNVATTGHIFHPGYEYLYQHEYSPKPEFIHRDWAIEDPRYIPQNAVIMLLWPPQTPWLTDPSCAQRDAGDAGTSPVLGLVTDRQCPLVRPDPFGMSLLLASPGYLLAIPALLRLRRQRLVVGAALAVGAIALVNLMHFSQGWVQFGYRFSNDFAPFAMIPVALGIARLGVRPLTLGVVALSILINAWGVYWGIALRW